jgi:hypothetical protein
MSTEKPVVLMPTLLKQVWETSDARLFTNLTEAVQHANKLAFTKWFTENCLRSYCEDKDLVDEIFRFWQLELKR